MYITLRDLQFISHFIFHVFPFFNWICSPITITGHVPHLGSSHFVTLLGLLSETNRACVNSFFKIFGCRRLTMNFVLSSIDFSFSEIFQKLYLLLYLFYYLGVVGVMCQDQWKSLCLIILVVWCS